MAGSHEYTQEVRDPIYGFVKLSQAEWNIVNTPEFGRLRDIRQLAMGHLVYPGANHTRFEHSIGCVHLSTLMFDALVERNDSLIKEEFDLPSEIRPRVRQLLRLAALLHDVGHPPFSHSGEALSPVATDPQSRQPVLDRHGRPKRLDHEEMTARIIRGTQLGARIQDEFRTWPIELEEIIAIATDYRLATGFKPLPYHAFLHEILTGELGSDRIDYLLRDAYHSGQKAGDFDYRRLIGSLAMVSPPHEDDTESRIGFDAGGWLVAEQMIVARYLMYLSLYFHKTKRIFEIHLEQFMRDWLQQRFGKAELPSDPTEYVKISDSTIIADLQSAAYDESHSGHQAALRFHGRSQMRLARELILAENYRTLGDGRRVPLKDRFDKLNNDISLMFGDDVVCDEPDHNATKMFGDTNKILVVLNDKTRYLDDISEIVRGMSDKIWRGRVYSESRIVGDVRRWCDEWLTDHRVDGFNGDAHVSG